MEDKLQTLKGFWNEHRVILIAVGIIVLIFLFFLGTAAHKERCTLSYEDRQMYKSLLWDYDWRAKEVNALACVEYPSCNCQNILNQIWYETK